MKTAHLGTFVGHLRSLDAPLEHYYFATNLTRYCRNLVKNRSTILHPTQKFFKLEKVTKTPSAKADGGPFTLL